MTVPPIVNRFATAEFVFDRISLIALDLRNADGDHAQVAMTAASARRLAKILTETADEIEGTNAPRQ